MPIPNALMVGLLQAAAAPDTMVARMIPQRDLFDWTSGVLQIIVLLLGIGMLVTLILLLLSVRTAVHKVNDAVDHFTKETRPLIARATGIVDDAREVVAMVRTDVERVTDAAGLISEQLIDAAETTSQRIDEVNAVLDVLQGELETTAIGTVSAIRGVRVGARTLSDRWGGERRSAGRGAFPTRDDADGPALAARVRAGVPDAAEDDDDIGLDDDEAPSA